MTSFMSQHCNVQRRNVMLVFLDYRRSFLNDWIEKHFVSLKVLLSSDGSWPLVDLSEIIC